MMKMKIVKHMKEKCKNRNKIKRNQNKKEKKY